MNEDSETVQGKGDKRDMTTHDAQIAFTSQRGTAAQVQLRDRD